MGKVRVAFIAAAFIVVSPAWGQSKNLAPGFSHLPKGATIVIMPADIELFSMSAGGVLEPKADWTETATRHLKAGFVKRKEKLGLRTVELAEKDADELHEVNTLHAAVARAIDLHHFGNLALPTKEGKLDWSLAEAVAPVKKASGADYALFSWIRDSYASAERKAAMIGLALLGVGISAGIQVGYASLVDLNTGQVVWFNRMARGHGDLREAEPAAETVDALLTAFPASK